MLVTCNVVLLTLWIVPVVIVRHVAAVVGVPVAVLPVVVLELPQAVMNIENNKSIVPARAWPSIRFTRITLLLLVLIRLMLA